MQKKAEQRRRMRCYWLRAIDGRTPRTPRRTRSVRTLDVIGRVVGAHSVPDPGVERSAAGRRGLRHPPGVGSAWTRRSAGPISEDALDAGGTSSPSSAGGLS